jgi:hypothetical protein
VFVQASRDPADHVFRHLRQYGTRVLLGGKGGENTSPGTGHARFGMLPEPGQRPRHLRVAFAHDGFEIVLAEEASPIRSPTR